MNKMTVPGYKETLKSMIKDEDFREIKVHRFPSMRFFVNIGEPETLIMFDIRRKDFSFIHKAHSERRFQKMLLDIKGLKGYI
jgi:hypothetical protein